MPSSAHTPSHRKSRNATLRLEALEDRLLLANLATALVPRPHFNRFAITDAATDGSPARVLSAGALQVNYDLSPGVASLANVTLEAWQGTHKRADFGSFTSSQLVNGYAGLVGANGPLPAGSYAIRARAHLDNGASIVSGWKNIGIVGGAVVNGGFQGETFTFSSMTGKGIVVNGGGGTDTLLFDISPKRIASINGMAPAVFDPLRESQAIFQGKLVDHIRLKNGTEIYLTGIERLEFRYAKSSVLLISMTVATQDARFAEQWNLHATDVPSAWRFSTGSATDILIASLDTGILPNQFLAGQITDINPGRLITDDADTDWFGMDFYGHGHQAISIMAATTSNGQVGAASLSPSFGAGINWHSPVYVADVYVGATLQSAIRDALDYAQANNMKVVFQGGIQGDSWWYSGGTPEDLETLISSAADYSLFAIAAGNFSDMGSVSGVAQLETNHANVMSVGALQRTPTTTNGKANASAVRSPFYSNCGPNLTVVAPTDSLATNFYSGNTGAMSVFGGTSCANPNLAAIASLVWSANPDLTGAEVRDIITSTAMDLGDAGRDNTFGHGLVNADLAVRRARALHLNPALASDQYWNALQPAAPPAEPKAFDLPSGPTFAVPLPPLCQQRSWVRAMVPAKGLSGDRQETTVLASRVLQHAFTAVCANESLDEFAAFQDQLTSFAPRAFRQSIA